MAIELLMAMRFHHATSAILLLTSASSAIAGDYGLIKAARRRPAPVVMELTATAYCQSGKTSFGVHARPGIVAADPRVLPPGSSIEIMAPDRYAGVYQVEDTGTAIKGRRLDVYMPSCLHAKRFGRQRVTVRLLNRGGRGSESYP
jgi:3D (Asp-Asp-Asp) domain-containing protein